MNVFKNCRQLTINHFAGVIIFICMVATPLFFTTGCQSTSQKMLETRTIDQLILHLKESGLKIDKLMRNVRYQAILASDGAVIIIEGANVEFYLYDINIDYQREKLAKIKKQGYIKVLGTHVPAITNGQFIMLTYSDSPNKIKSIRAFQNLK